MDKSESVRGCFQQAVPLSFFNTIHIVVAHCFKKWYNKYGGVGNVGIKQIL